MTLDPKPKLDGQPIEIISHQKDDTVVIVTWDRGPRGLYLVDVETGDSQKIQTDGLVAYPFLSHQYVIWSEQSVDDGTWEVRYELRP